jgi:hypothetical protein
MYTPIIRSQHNRKQLRRGDDLKDAEWWERTFSSRATWASQARTHCLRGHGFDGLDQLQATASAVVGSISERTLAMLLAGKPPFCACVRTDASSGAT